MGSHARHTARPRLLHKAADRLAPEREIWNRVIVHLRPEVRGTPGQLTERLPERGTALGIPVPRLDQRGEDREEEIPVARDPAPPDERHTLRAPGHEPNRALLSLGTARTGGILHGITARSERAHPVPIGLAPVGL